MTAVAAETTRAVELMERVETLESVAWSLPEQDDRRSRLLSLVEKDLATAAPLRPRVAAQLLGLSEKTVRAWVEEGVLLVADTSSPRLLLDVERVHDVLHLVNDLRTAGRTVGLLDEVHRRLADASWLDRADLTESLEQMRRGEGHVIAAALTCPARSRPLPLPSGRSPGSAALAARPSTPSCQSWPTTAAGPLRTA